MLHCQKIDQLESSILELNTIKCIALGRGVSTLLLFYFCKNSCAGFEKLNVYCDHVWFHARDFVNYGHGSSEPLLVTLALQSGTGSLIRSCLIVHIQWTIQKDFTEIDEYMKHYFFNWKKFASNPFHSGYWWKGPLTNSEDPDEMQHMEALWFSPGSALFAKIKTSLGTHHTTFYRNFEPYHTK